MRKVKSLMLLLFFVFGSYVFNASASDLTFDNTAWQYDADNDVYWQIGVVYCAIPETTDYESLGIYVPGAYLACEDNGNGAYTCSANCEGTVGGFTAETAPIVFPVNTPGYSAQAAPTSYRYDDIASYLEAGFIYVLAGMRGRQNGYDADGNLIYSGGAPWAVTDLKAAIRYYRYNKEILPGNVNSIFTFGHSGGGAQSTLMGATGDSPLYDNYLELIGAAMVDTNGKPISDAIAGAMAWCPITSLDFADQAYEWNMGQFSSAGTRADDSFQSALSKDLAVAYAKYINALRLKDENGNELTLTQSDEDINMAGSYYDYLLSVIEQSLNNFLSDTEFPYTESSGGGPPFGPPGDQTGLAPATFGATETGLSGFPGDQTEVTSKTYETVEDYIASLNADEQWVTYDAATNTATVSSVAAFVRNVKSASKAVPAFDDIDRGQAENYVFGNDESDAVHFDFSLAKLLQRNQETYAAYADWDASIIDEYGQDLMAVDEFGNGIETRMNMYNPMYYLLPYYQGYRSSHVARYWRISTGIEQGDTATTIEMNLALALQNYKTVKEVQFQSVWAQGHTMAERTGDATENFIAWVTTCASQKDDHPQNDDPHKNNKRQTCCFNKHRSK